jgi:cytochrome c oxidase subunit 2
MKQIIHPSYFALALIAVLLTISTPRAAHADQPVKTIDITAKRFEFSPNQITLKKGETVKLRLTSADVTHGFFHRAFKIDEVIEPGKPTEVTLTPQTVGTFTTICDHFCGVNHGAMKMTIVVTE